MTDTTSCQFRIVIQGKALTGLITIDTSTPLSDSDLASQIRAAMNSATQTIDWKIRETSSFSVWVQRRPTYIQITVQFEVDVNAQLTLLDVISYSLDGIPLFARLLHMNNILYLSFLYLRALCVCVCVLCIGPNPSLNPSVSVMRVREHTPFPVGFVSLSIDYPDSNITSVIDMPWDASVETAKALIETSFNDFDLPLQVTLMTTHIIFLIRVYIISY